MRCPKVFPSRWVIPPVLVIIALSLVWTSAVWAKIYKYQRNGVWYYSDVPPEGVPTENQTVMESSTSAADSSSGDGGKPLLENYPARNAIERAVAGTVAVKSGMGYGSGFFISATGHIFTNKHVIRSNDRQTEQNESAFKEVEGRIAEYERQFKEEEQKLRNYKSRIENLKQAAAEATNPQRKKAYTEDYEDNLKSYKEWQEAYGARKKQFEAERNQFRSGRAGYDYSKSVADLAQSFTIVLADKTELFARLLAVSKEHDLALLKIDGYSVPALKPGQPNGLTQSTPVYAIGNPATLQNSVTSGVFSGFQAGFIQTNAQIYPGNSGGPLVDEAGRVLGINTFKQITHKFEGLGFAIPIQTALSEFARHLPAQ